MYKSGAGTCSALGIPAFDVAAILARKITGALFIAGVEPVPGIAKITMASASFATLRSAPAMF